MRVRGMINFLLPFTFLMAGIIVRRAAPDMWINELFFAGYRLYLTVIAVSLLTLFGEVYLVKRRERHWPSRQPGEALRRSTATELFGKGWWAVWGLLVLGVVLLSFF